jgi:ADP-heptose:LPS heptosyltransferase
MLEHMGDVVAVEPLIREAKHRQPTAHLTFAVSPAWRPLVEHHPLVDHVLELACLGDWVYLAAPRVFDTVHDLQTRGRWCPKTDLLLRREDVPAEINIENYYHHGPLLHAATIAGGFGETGLADLAVDPQPTLHLPPDLSLPPGLPSDFVVFHTTSNQAERDWNQEGWIGLAGHLQQRGQTIVIVGGREDQPVQIPDAIDFRRRLNVLETAHVIRHAKLFVGIDSGPAHLANAVGADGLVLLGHYRDFERYCPYTGRFATRVHQHDGPASRTPVEEVLPRVVELL